MDQALAVRSPLMTIPLVQMAFTMKWKYQHDSYEFIFITPCLYKILFSLFLA